MLTSYFFTPALIFQLFVKEIVIYVFPHNPTFLTMYSTCKCVFFCFYSISGKTDQEIMSMALPASQDELPSRSMEDSFLWARIPLGTDIKLREKYVNFHNHVRFGRLLEDLDTMSGILLIIAFKPLGLQTCSFTIVKGDEYLGQILDGRRPGYSVM